MTNDKFIYHLLYSFIEKLSVPDQINVLENPVGAWKKFVAQTKSLEGPYEEIRYIMRNIVSEIHRKDRLHCQYCRIEEGLLVKSPVEPHNLCKVHRQEYETRMEDRTLRQVHPAISDFVGKEGLNCSAPPRR